MNASMRLASIALALIAMVFGIADARATGFPDKPVRFIVGFAPGGGTDTVARLVAKKLSDVWNQSVVVENRPGGDGSIAAGLIAHATPDGYTIAWITNAHTITASEHKASYDAVTSFAPVTIASSIPDLFLVNSSVPVNNLKEFIAYAKARPGKLNFGSAGAKTPPHLEMLDLMKRTGIDMVGVPFKGSAPAIIALLGNDIQVMFGAMSSTIAQVKAGKIKALAISSAERSKVVPDVPTVAEALNMPDYEGGVWYGALAPAGTPKDVVAKLNQDIVAALKSKEIQARFDALGFETVADTPDQFTNVLKRDIAKWSALLKDAKAK